MPSNPSQQYPSEYRQQSPLKNICVFCGSNTGMHPEFITSAIDLGKELCNRKIQLIYGGGSTGLMGALADSVLAGGGHVTGIIPRGLATPEIAHQKIQRMELVDTMHQRKMLMHEYSDALIALPGGYGTFEELLEAITWLQLGLSLKPVGLLNIRGYYDSLLKQFDRASSEGFVRPEFGDLIVSSTLVSNLIPRLQSTTLPHSTLWNAD